MKAKKGMLLGMIVALGVTSLFLGQGTAQSPRHDTAPSLACFTCHGPHPARNAEEIDLLAFAVPPHDFPPGEEKVLSAPGLNCAQCHTYPEAVEEIGVNSCVGCHRRGGFPLEKALERLSDEVGHPNVISMIKSVPQDCTLCHAKNLGPNLHRRHLFERPKFMLHFQGGCTTCHRVGEDGVPKMDNYPP